MSQSSFSLRGRNPDILTCIANLSNDEVFTPPELVNQILDSLADSWAASHGGENIWANQTVKFLDPCTKTGVFLREITRRLTKGLEREIPNLDKRVSHILANQVFGIGITQITSLLARRSVYCSKHATSKHSIGKSLPTDAGNIWFDRTEHSWNAAKCEYCAAPRSVLERDEELENYAYPFIHTVDVKAWVNGIFGGTMQFDVIIGNPPYQMKGGAGGSSDSSIYHLFVEQAKRLDPIFLSMVIPSRWLAGGRGMEEFRQTMLGSQQISKLIDFPVSSEVFPNVEVKGGICYFVWSVNYAGECEVKVIRGEEELSSMRRLDEFDVFVRDARAIGILHKVLAHTHVGMDTIVSNREPFRLESNFDGYHAKKGAKDIALHYVQGGKRGIGFIARDAITKNVPLIDSWKVLIPKAGSDGGQKIPDSVLGKPWLSGPPSACTGSFLAIPADSKDAALSINSYYVTKFFRFLVSLRKITQDAFSHMYAWAPVQRWDREWKDEELYKSYGLTTEEVDYIETVIRPMDNSETSEDD